MSVNLSMVRVTLLEDGPNLDSLRDTANNEHQLVVTAAGEMIQHALVAGHALIQARELVPYGQWMQWVEHEFVGSVSNANFYRRLAMNEALVLQSGTRTLREANRFLTEHAEITTPMPRTGSLVEQRRQEILDLKQTGIKCDEIASIMGVSTGTVYNLARKDWKRVNRQRNASRKQATRALKRQERDRAASKVGGDMSEAYALVRKTALTLQRAVEGASNKQAREHLGRALDRLYRCEDEISRAIREADST